MCSVLQFNSEEDVPELLFFVVGGGGGVVWCVCVCVCVCVCACVCVCEIYRSINMCLNTRPNVLIVYDRDTHTHKRTHTHKHTRMHTHTLMEWYY